MKAIYQEQKADVLEQEGDLITLVIQNTEEQIDVSLSDKDLIVDPTDDEWNNAN